MTLSIEKIALIGAGTMGNGIAQVCAAAGLTVVMIDVAEPAVQKGLANIRSRLARLVEKNKLSPAEGDLIVGRIKGTTDYDALRGCDLVIEAATENERLKLQILNDANAQADSGAIIATNTSSISITRLAAATGRPDRFIGMHFFNPVPLMALVEVIRGMRTSDATYEATTTFAKRIGKTPVTVKNHPGFVVNRILCPMINEAIFALQEGVASAEDIDTAMRLGCNHPVGPLALADLIGLDTLLSIMEVFYSGFSESKYRAAPLLREMVDGGYLGRKTGQGFYTY